MNRIANDIHDTKRSDSYGIKVAPPAAQVVRKNEITERMGGLEYEIDELFSYIGHLEDRLQSVLAPHSPDGKEQQESPAVDRTELGSSLRNLSQRLKSARARICSLLDRLEV